MRYNSIFQKAGLIILSILLSLFSMELALRVIYPAQTHYFVWQPGLQHHFFPDTSVLGGLQSTTTFTINRFGLRTDNNDLQNGPDLFHSHPGFESGCYLCIGASTTEGLYLDDGNTWPAQFAKAAQRANDSTFRFIGNLAKSGCTMRENYIQLKYCVPQYRQVNTVFVMSGLNDMLRRLSLDTLYQPGFRFTPEIEDSLVHTIFLKQGRGQGKTWLRRTALFYLLQNAWHSHQPHSVNWMVQDNSGRIYSTWRNNRKQAKRFIDTLPDMTAALNEYAYIINRMIDEAEKQKLSLVFINESALWKDSMTNEEISKIWQGGIGKFQMESGHAYYSPAALRHGLEMYNQKLLAVCATRGVRVIDIDSKLPHSLSVFYDDCHFTVLGAHEIGNIVYNEFKHQ